MVDAGLVSIDRDNRWIGGRYYLHHLARCVAQSHQPDVRLREIVWGSLDSSDPFAEVRAELGDPVVIRPPTHLWPRAWRKVRNLAKGRSDAGDLFQRAGVDVLFPIPPCAYPGIPYVFWLPDFQYLRRPDLMTTEMRDQLEGYFRHHVLASSQIVLSSEDARADFEHVYPQHLHRTHVVRFCSVPDEAWWKEDPVQVAQRHGLPDKFFIVCNQFTRHKNHLMLMEALRQLVGAGHGDLMLACTGSTFDHRQENYAGQVHAFLDRHGLSRHVRILGLIPRSEQIALVRRSAAVLQPSSFEGWSTVIEDAKTLGRPIFASDLPVHAEQLPGQRLLGVDAPDEWAEALGRAWPHLHAGPSHEQEQQGATNLRSAQQECARAFTHALRAAATGGSHAA